MLEKPLNRAEVLESFTRMAFCLYGDNDKNLTPGQMISKLYNDYLRNYGKNSMVDRREVREVLAHLQNTAALIVKNTFLLFYFP